MALTIISVIIITYRYFHFYYSLPGLRNCSDEAIFLRSVPPMSSSNEVGSLQCKPYTPERFGDCPMYSGPIQRFS